KIVFHVALDISEIHILFPTGFIIRDVTSSFSYTPNQYTAFFTLPQQLAKQRTFPIFGPCMHQTQQALGICISKDSLQIWESRSRVQPPSPVGEHRKKLHPVGGLSIYMADLPQESFSVRQPLWKAPVVSPVERIVYNVLSRLDGKGFRYTEIHCKQYCLNDCDRGEQHLLSRWFQHPIEKDILTMEISVLQVFFLKSTKSYSVMGKPKIPDSIRDGEYPERQG
ncbi:hypothetical protein STEG23_001039, partial [Scotinomys teguina]